MLFRSAHTIPYKPIKASFDLVIALVMDKSQQPPHLAQRVANELELVQCVAKGRTKWIKTSTPSFGQPMKLNLSSNSLSASKGRLSFRGCLRAPCAGRHPETAQAGELYTQAQPKNPLTDSCFHFKSTL